MQLRKILALRGPNLWANYPVLEAWLDLESLAESSSDQLPGFNDRLKAWLPSLIEHRCSEGCRGGFFQRLDRGTWQGHILEHIALELQTLVGPPVGFGRTRASHEPGVYKVVIEHENEELGRAALHAGLRICLAAVHDTPIDVAKEITELRELAARVLPRPSTAALLRAARVRRIPAQQLTADGLLRLGYGARQRRLLYTQTDRTSAAADSVARDRELTFTLLRGAGITVPKTEIVSDPGEAWAAAEDLGLPVVIRPLTGAGRLGASWNLMTQDEIQSAFAKAALHDPRVLIEKQLSEASWQLLVVGEEMVAAVLLGPESVDSLIPGADATARVHPDVAARAVEAARLVGLDVAAVDVVAGDVRKSLEEQNGVVVGINPRPDLEPFFRKNADPQPVAAAILERLYPEGHTGRIPVVAVTGVNGKTTTTRLMAHILARTHQYVGFTCTEGIYIDGRRIEAGDCSGPQSARTILTNPQVEAAVLETARGGILRAGLGFDRCDVAIVTNIGEGDHLGLNDIQTVEELARVKGTIVDVVVRDGAAVLKVDDPLVYAMKERCTKGHVIFFGRDPNHPLLVEHRARGGKAAYVREGHVCLAEGAREIQLAALARIPLTHGGLIAFQVENVLAAAAAAWSLGVAGQVIRIALETFGNDMRKSPGRFNLFEVKGATVVLDYGHNASALASIIEALDQLPTPKRRVAVYSTAGDRRDRDLIRQGELLGNAFDRVILYEDHYLRGRKEGEIIALFRQGVEKGKRTRQIEELRGAVKAMEYALETLEAGEHLLLQADVVDESVDFMRHFLARYLAATAPALTEPEPAPDHETMPSQTAAVGG